VWPVRTNANFLFNALLHPAFGAAELDTGFIARELDALIGDPEPDEAIWRGAAAVAMAEDEDAAVGLAGFRLNAPALAEVALGRGGSFRAVALDDDHDVAPVSGFRDDERVVVFLEGQAYAFDRTARGTVGAGAHDGDIVAPMPGKVTSVEVAAGDRVTKGQRLLTLEAMKMEHGLTAPFHGVVTELNASAGAQVQVDAVLAKIEKEDT
jgi:3-methylcrotonyl-CoA carboxylase alpha subunit